MASNTSVLTIVVFSIERYVAICFPLRTGNFFLSDHERIVRVIACVWFVSLVVATPFAAFTTINHINYTNTSCMVDDSAFCAMLDSNVPPSLPIYELSGLLFFLVPLVTLMVLYRKMGEALKNSPFWNRSSTGNGTSGESRRFNNNNERNAATTVRMLFAVVVTFFLCWAPFHLQRLLYIHGQNLKHYLLINEWLYYIAGFSYYVSATINPILYNLMSSRFRRAFRKNICMSLCWAEARSQRQRHYNQQRGTSFAFRRRRNVATRRHRPRFGGRHESVELVVELEQPEHIDKQRTQPFLL